MVETCHQQFHLLPGTTCGYSVETRQENNTQKELDFESESRSYVPLNTIWEVILETFLPANPLASTEETKPNATEANIYPEHGNTTTENKHQKNTARFGRIMRPPAWKCYSSRGPHDGAPRKRHELISLNVPYGTFLID